MDPCSINPCKNKGQCSNKRNAYACVCKSGFTGKVCSNVDPCTKTPCKNGGTCTSNGTLFTCTCKPGYTGKDCSIAPTTPIPAAPTTSTPAATTTTIPIATTTTIPIDCRNSVADIMFMLDESSSIKEHNFRKIKEFLKFTIKSFNIGPDAVRIGIITFHHRPTHHFDMNVHQNLSDLFRAIDTIPYNEGLTYTDLGLDYLRMHSFTEKAGDRPGVPNIAIVITDGKSRNLNLTAEAATKLKKTGVVVFAIGIGSRVKMNELNAIATTPVEKDVFTVEHFDALDKIKDELVYQACTIDPCKTNPCMNGGTCTSNGTLFTCTCKPDYTGKECSIAPTTPIPTATTTTTHIDCRNSVADIMFMLDESSSIKEHNFRKIKEFLKFTIKSFNIGPDAVRIGIITFHHRPTHHFDMNVHQNLADLLKAIDTIPYNEGLTYTDLGLDYLRMHSFTEKAGDRPGVPNIAIVITDGKSRNLNLTAEAATKLKKTGAVVFAIGIGSRVKMNELNAIATTPVEKDVFTVEHFDALDKIKDELVYQACTIDPCKTNPCMNGGTCTSTGTLFTCTCKPGYTGKECSIAPTTPIPTATTTTTHIDCRNSVADIMFMLDESSSIKEHNFRKIKDFLKFTIKSFNIALDAVRIGIITFHHRPTHHFDMNVHQNLADLLTAIDTIPYNEGLTYTDLGLDYLRMHSFTEKAGDRPGVPNIAIVITDGKSRNLNLTAEAATKLKKTGAVVFAIGIGSRVKMNELNVIATTPVEKDVFTVENFDALDKIENELIYQACTMDPCKNNPCKNGGTCTRRGKMFTCTCKPGYVGKECSIDPCGTNPCKHGGQCRNTENTYTCVCKLGYAGKNCTKEMIRNPCKPNPCKNGGTCINNGKLFTCACKSGYTGNNCSIPLTGCICRVSGDPHYRTFDGQMIHFMGACKYTLAESKQGINQTHFNVEVKNEYRLNTRVIHTRQVEVKINGITLNLLPGRKVMVNGELMTLPLTDYMGFNVDYSTGWITVTTDFGLKVQFDGNHRVTVRVPSTYKNQMTGICGDCNGKKDDFRTKNGVDVSKNRDKYTLVGQSYLVLDGSDDMNKTAKNCTSEVNINPCKKEDTKICDLMKDQNGTFASCLKKINSEVDDYFKLCNIAACANVKPQKAKKQTICQSFEALIHRCEDAGIPVDWRNIAECPKKCPSNTEYTFATSGNQPTCSNKKPICSSHFFEGCICKKGFILSGTECVPIGSCGCVFEGTYLKLNAEILLNDCSEWVRCLSNGKIRRDPGCSENMGCAVVGGKRICNCNEGYERVKEKCKAIPPSNTDRLSPVMHMFIRVSLAYIEGKSMINSTLKHVSMCADWCLSLSTCKSFNYDELTLSCDLYSINAATDVTLTSSECPFKDYFQRIDSTVAVINGASILTCIHLEEYGGIRSQAQCRQTCTKFKCKAMAFSKYYEECSFTHTGPDAFAITGDEDYIFTQIFDKLPVLGDKKL